MTLQEKIVDKYVAQAILEFDSSPLARGFLRRLANESPAMFLAAAMKHLRSNENSNGHRYLAVLALRQDELTGYLASPANATREVARNLFLRFLGVDPSFDVKLARKLPDRNSTKQANAFTVTQSTRALDILDQTSRGRRLLPIVGHLPHVADDRIAAKATLFVGRRVMSPAWSAAQLAREEQRIRANAVEAIWGFHSPAAVHLFEMCVKDRNNRVLGNALLGLHILGHRSIEAELLSMARTEAPEYRSTAAWAMGRTAQEKWVDALTVMVRDEHPQVRGMAFRSLKAIRQKSSPEVGQPEVVPPTIPQTPPDGATYEAFPNYHYLRY